MNDRLLANPVTPAFALLAGALVRLRATLPAPSPNDAFAVLAAGAHLRDEITARVGAEPLDEAIDDLCFTYYPSLETLPPIFSRAEVREAVLGGIYSATARARIGRISLVLGIEYGVRALASVHIAAAHDVAAAAHQLLGSRPQATRLRPV